MRRNLSYLLMLFLIPTLLQACGNAWPVANAGEDSVAAIGDTVTLDGSASRDPNGDTLTFTWAMTSRPTDSLAELSTTSGKTTTFVPDQIGEYIITLRVSDGEDFSTDTVTVRAYGVENLPSTGDVTVLVIHDDAAIYGWQPLETLAAADAIIRLYYPNLVAGWEAGTILATEIVIPVENAMSPELYTVDANGDIVLL